MGVLFRYIKLYFYILAMNIKVKFTYKTNFYTGLLHSLILGGTSIANLWVILSRFDNINGWNIYEIAFMMGLSKMAFALYMTFFNQTWMMDMSINTGEIDRLMTKPKSILFLFITQKFEVAFLGDIVIAGGMMLYSLLKSGVSLTLVNTLFILVVIVSSTLIFSSIILMGGTMAFWTLKSRSIKDFLFTMFNMFNSYPANIYGRYIQCALSFIIPFAFIYYYPSLHFFNKHDSIFPGWIAYISPAIAVCFCALSVFIWSMGLRAYKSSGT
jgi:ABC-2 type transport system permease protein